MPDPATVVNLSQGKYRGVLGKDCTAYKGIRYAQAPIGERRFCAPAPLPPSDDLHNASSFGPACAQVIGMPRVGDGRFGRTYSEDCLTLNIYTPAADSARRPVMVWIHGGAFVTGSGNLYDGTHLAQAGDIVVVTINYRLGVFGFVDLAAVASTDTPSNLGLRDQIAALRWVRDNIAAFGGDPDRVTIAGESAGSIAISLLMLCDEARGLFRGAIMQSGAINLIHDRRMASRVADAYRNVLGGISAANLKNLPTDTLLQAQIDASKALNGALSASPWYDGTLLPENLKVARAKPTAAVNLLAGFNRDETALFEKVPGAQLMRLDRPFLVEQFYRELRRDHAADILENYRNTKLGTRRLATDLYFAMSTRHFAERQATRAPTWFYRFDYRQPWLGAAHALELLFIWNWTGLLPALLRGGPLLGARATLAAKMRTHWINFIRNGDPGDGWQGFDKAGQHTMIFDITSRMETDPDRTNRLAWDGADITPKRI